MKLYHYVLKLDLDYKLSKDWLKKWEKSRRGLLDSLGFQTTNFIIVPSDKRGYHCWIHIRNKIPSRHLKPKDLVMLQILCGSDLSREVINLARIKRGMAFRTSNKLFSKVLYRREPDYEKKEVYKILKKLKPKYRQPIKTVVDRLYKLEYWYRTVLEEGRKELKK